MFETEISNVVRGTKFGIKSNDACKKMWVTQKAQMMG